MRVSTNVRRVSALSVRGAVALCCLPLSIPLTVSSAQSASAAVTVTSHFIWTATSSNISTSFTFINNATTNGAPNARLFVTPTDDPGGVCGCVTDPAPVGALWAGGARQWTIFNEDLSNMPVGASFNVLVVQKAGANVFTTTATSQNTTANGMTINSKAINGKPNAILQVTESLPNGIGGPFNPHPIGVVYGLGPTGNQWAIQNVDNAAMPIGAEFNVMVGATSSNGGKAVLLTGTSTNTTGSQTFVSNSETNGNPNAVVFETQNADPGLHFGAGDVATTGVLYTVTSKDRVAVFNESGSAMPAFTHYFNLLIFSS
jgi:hypothetical protein